MINIECITLTIDESTIPCGLPTVKPTPRYFPGFLNNSISSVSVSIGSERCIMSLN